MCLQIYACGVNTMPKIPVKEKEQRYFLTRKGRYKTLHVSRGDHVGVEWWAKQRKIAITEALHQIIHEFVGPRLEAFR